MYLTTLEVTMTPRTNTKPYNVQLNTAMLEILALIFEFKVATAWQITRFLKQKDLDKYLYLKLHRMWHAGFLESCKVYIGTRAGMPVYYMLSKRGLRILEERGLYTRSQLKAYPHVKTLLSLNLFKHEAQVVELASLEAMNKTDTFALRFKGETNSMAREYLSNKNVEVLTPDYTVWYPGATVDECVYTEFERTQKSKEASLRKIERYVQYLNPEQREHVTLRMIFQTPRMEELFWLIMMTGGATLLQKLCIHTTNLLLLHNHEQFLEPVYASEKTIQLTKHGRLGIMIADRIKLFSFV